MYLLTCAVKEILVFFSVQSEEKQNKPSCSESSKGKMNFKFLYRQYCSLGQISYVFTVSSLGGGKILTTVPVRLSVSLFFSGQQIFFYIYK